MRYPAETAHKNDLSLSHHPRIGEHVGLHTVFDSVVDVTIQMNRQIRDRHQISSGINQHGFHAVSVTYHHAARQGKRTVKPWGTDHSAVALHVQAGVMTSVTNGSSPFTLNVGQSLWLAMIW